MRVLVCGGREYDDWLNICQVLDALKSKYGIDHLVTGDATGADSLAMIWATMRHVRCAVYRAHWGKHGLAAGPMRNARMLLDGKPDVVVAFPGGKGTRNMVGQATKAGVQVVEIELVKA